MISIVYDVNIYRKFLNETISENDVVIEIGPHTGASTKMYADRAALVVAVDKSQEAQDEFEKLSRVHENIKFIRCDARTLKALDSVVAFFNEKGYTGCDVLAVDMGGGRYPDTVFKVWSLWAGVFKPGDSIIRNRGLAEFVQRAEIRDDSIIKKFDDDGWLYDWGRDLPSQLKDKFKEQFDEFKLWLDKNALRYKKVDD